MSKRSIEIPVAYGKLVELTYKLMDSKTSNTMVKAEFPIGYVHGVNKILAPTVTAELEGKLPGTVIEVPIDCNKLFAPRDESLVVTDMIENVPEEYREVGKSILMANDQGNTKIFIVTSVDKQTVTIDGNNPLCGRKVIFHLEILMVREATEEEITHGGLVNSQLDIHEIIGLDNRVKSILY